MSTATATNFLDELAEAGRFEYEARGEPKKKLSAIIGRNRAVNVKGSDRQTKQTQRKIRTSKDPNDATYGGLAAPEVGDFCYLDGERLAVVEVSELDGLWLLTIARHATREQSATTYRGQSK